jgi:hypothetical protein
MAKGRTASGKIKKGFRLTKSGVRKVAAKKKKRRK